MRQGQNSKRSRGRGAGRRNVPPRHQTFDSNGPSVRIRGSAYQVHEKYLALARDAGSAGDRIAAENYLQHAEHYFRIINMDSDGEGQSRGRGQQNGSGRGGQARDGQDGAESATAPTAAQTDGEAAAPEAEVVRPNGAGEQPDVIAEEAAAGEEPAPAPKRRASRGAGRTRSPRASSKAAAPDESSGSDTGGGEAPPADE